MNKLDGLFLINKIDRLVANNNSVISAIDSGKDINITKAIKASMKSNNELAFIVKNIIGADNLSSNSYENTANDFLKYFQNK